MARIQCFFLESTGRERVSLRRYRNHSDTDESSHCPTYPGKYSYHTVMSCIGEEPTERDELGYTRNSLFPMPPHDDPRWPTLCSCGYVFQEDDEWQRFTEAIYRRVDTGEEMTLRDAPAGAMWDAWWMSRFCTPQDEYNLAVKTPGGDWMIDSQASNCTMPEDWKQEHHHCWVRTGEPPLVTAGKDGPTCGAGAGSIQCGDYHGFLRNGWLED